MRKVEKVLHIYGFFDSDSAANLEYLKHAVRRLISSGISRKEFTVDTYTSPTVSEQGVPYYTRNGDRLGPDDGKWEDRIHKHGVKSIPTVIYYLGSQERVRFEEPTTSVSYFWKALRLLRPYRGPALKRRKKRGWEKLNADTKKRRKSK